MKHCATCTCPPYSDEQMLTAARILCAMEGLTLEEARARWSTQHVYTRRHRVIAAFRRLHPELGLKVLAALFERNHSSIVHSCFAAPVPAVDALIKKFQEAARDGAFFKPGDRRDGHDRE